ncbi:hypothetical protein [Goodfellowiella coeruleoviolacea]|uniref:Uncharacterized protein n=1 Tax=Goodfellowiella coeruleoviolacea TaxID=334858 RepID=A0AAE3GF43_9PSEU|nr:hypothetical protein [Goodfellowiella coeruleoviolacea]MCP2166169.1 hypothetical protein [Goodfellowiella coeruleoviolacea]
MDEHDLAELFRDAVRDTPPASFDEHDVAAAARRATARQRTRVLVGSGAVVLALLGVGVVGYGLTARQHTATSTMTVAEDQSSAGRSTTTAELGPLNAPAPQNTDSDGTLENRRSGPPPKSIPESSSKQGDENTGSASRSAGSTPTGCGQVDRELAVALANELPVDPATVPAPVAGSCPAGARAASYLVRDGGTTGVVSVVVVPATADATAPRTPELPSTNGSARATVHTGSGGQLTVVSQPQAGSTSAPFADRIDRVASQLAGRY